MAEPSFADISRILRYDAREGGLFWRVRTSSRAAAGSEAGCKRRDGYVVIGIRGRMYLAHRLAWLLHYGAWPPEEVDHKDGNPNNNAIGNLRLASHSENGCNKKMQPNNTSGVTGVTWHARDKKWQAQIKRNGRMLYLGHFAKLADAVHARQLAEMQLFGSFVRRGAAKP